MGSSGKGCEHNGSETALGRLGEFNPRRRGSGLPAFLAIDPNGAIAWNAYICGGVISLVAIVGLASPQQWEEWPNLVVGAWLFFAPFGMGFSQSNAGLTMMTLGILVVAFAIWGLVDLSQRRAHPA